MTQGPIRVQQDTVSGSRSRKRLSEHQTVPGEQALAGEQVRTRVSLQLRLPGFVTSPGQTAPPAAVFGKSRARSRRPDPLGAPCSLTRGIDQRAGEASRP